MNKIFAMGIREKGPKHANSLKITLSLILLLAGGFLVSKNAHAQNAVLTDDAYVNPGIESGGKNFGSAGVMQIKGSGSSSGVQKGFVKFTLSNLPAGATAASTTKAVLTVFVDDLNTAGSINVQNVTGNWSESTVTANNQPLLGSIVATGIPINAENSFVSIDVTSAVQNWLRDPSSNKGLALVPNTANVNFTFETKEDRKAGHEARLEIITVGSIVAGPTGPTGPTGATGANGLNGFPGATGATGARGPAGLTGAQGPTGAAGATGAPGTTGAQGPAGATGAQGSAGSAGATGAQGLEGPAGANGAPGVTGAPGPTGATGAQGSAGPAGATGVQGPEGSAGANGVPGVTGAQGPTGAQGVAGATGAQGSAGPAGATGAQGLEGPAGANGAAGAQGPTGPTGAQGSEGLTGATGASGATGAQGPTGAAGSTGTQGYAGPAGTPGTQGPAGPVGPSGSTGAQGPAGTAGTTAPYTGAVYRWTMFSPFSNAAGFLGNSDSTLYGGASPNSWLGNISAAGINPDAEGLRTLFNRKGYAGNNANVVSESSVTADVRSGKLAGTLFRIKNTTGSPIVWTPCFYYTAFSGWGETSSVTVNGQNSWSSGLGSGSTSNACVGLGLPPNRVSTIIVMVGSSPGPGYSVSGVTLFERATVLIFNNNSLALPAGLSYVDDLDTLPSGTSAWLQ